MLCDTLQEQFKKFQDALNRGNAAEIVAKFHLSKGMSVEDVRDVLIHQFGRTPDGADAMLNNGGNYMPDMARRFGELNELGDKAVSTMKEAQAPGTATVNDSWLKQTAKTFREKVVDAFSRSFNALPRGMNDALRKALENLASFKDIISLGDNVYAGRNQRFLISREMDNLHKQSGTDLSRKDFSVGFEGLMRLGRGKNKISIEDARKQISELTDKGQVMSSNVSLKDLRRKVDLADSIKDLPGVQDYVKETHRRMDVARKAAFGEGGKEDYYHNSIITEPHQDVWDSITSGDRKTKSDLNKRKAFDTGFEAELKGFRPASDDFVETNGTYWSAIANKVRKQKIADQFRKNGELDNANPDKMMIETGKDSAEPAFVVRPDDAKDWERPKTEDGRDYREMHNIGGDQFRGIYAHPEVHQWQEKVFRTIKPDGIAAGALKGMRMWKTILLGGAAIPHAMSLAKKYGYLAAKFGLRDGVNNIWNIKSGVTEGLAVMDQKSPDHDIFLKGVQNNLSLETHDMARNAAFDRKYDIKTGDQTVISNLSEQITNVTDWVHRTLFEKIRTGMKLNMFVKVAKSDYFQDRIKFHGGDADAAYKELATIVNDHFGGQNLEAIGRGKLVQSFMQALLLSPEWTEAKFKRNFGALMNPNDEIRRSYQISLAAELGTFMIMRTVVQNLYSQMYNDPRTMDQQFQDMMNGKFASVYIGKAGKKEIFVDMGLSENQDVRMLLAPFKGLYQSGAQQDPSQLFKEIGKEVGHKLSPGAKGVVDLMQSKSKREEAGEQKMWEKKSALGKVGSMASNFLPIGVQQAGQAMEGTYGPGAGIKAGSMVGNVVGAPVVAYNPVEVPKKKKK